jgi:hypothetical protein
MPYITVGKETNIRLYYEDHGSGGPVILITDIRSVGRRGKSRSPCCSMPVIG